MLNQTELIKSCSSFAGAVVHAQVHKSLFHFKHVSFFCFFLWFNHVGSTVFLRFFNYYDF